MFTPITATAAPSRPGTRTAGARCQRPGGVPRVNAPDVLTGTPVGHAASRQGRSAPSDRGVVALPAAGPVLGGTPHGKPDNNPGRAPSPAGAL